MQRLRPFALAFALMGLTLCAVGCIWHQPGTLDSPGVEMVNKTDLTLEIRYLGKHKWQSPEEVETYQFAVKSEPGEDWAGGGHLSANDPCLDAPMAAYTPDGTEVDRLPAGTCIEEAREDIHWVITAN